ncbi:cold-shock protein [Secundilactobacillus hailunensis]|uniref:Cold-shock protein n=1 Tax=Secundilactobacillus hailunensis TaxID=2559923 RepID=A0ABW1TCS0_9LACO|nr:cold shock domain-containing protein [Secundilactobacillus hailunensis]
MIKGKVERYNEQNGFGFIKSEAGESLFVHYTGIEMGGFKKLTPGQEVEFVVVEGQKGPQAARVRPVQESTQTDSEA